MRVEAKGLVLDAETQPASKAVNRRVMRSLPAGDTPTIPSASATAKVSRPSGTTSAMSLATTD